MPKLHGIYFVRMGEHGPGVWFLHGAGGYHGVWISYLRILRHEVRGLVLDLPGHGKSDALKRHSLEGYAQALLEFWEQTAQGSSHAVPAPVVLIGHSLGGAIALYLALEFQHLGHPPRIIVLLGSAFRFSARSTSPPQDRQTLCHALFHRQAWLRRCLEAKTLPLFTSPETLARDLRCVQHFDFRPLAPKLHTKIIWIHGEQDQILPISLVQESARWVQSHKIYTIPDTGHMLHLEARDRVLQILKEVIHS